MNATMQFFALVGAAACALEALVMLMEWIMNGKVDMPDADDAF